MNVDQILPVLANWKKEGRIRYFGVTHHELPYFGPLAQYVERGEIDFVRVHYSIAIRQAEERILPAALDKGVAVQVNMPFEKARLFKIVEGKPLPGFDKVVAMPPYPGKAYNGIIRRAQAARAAAAKQEAGIE